MGTDSLLAADIRALFSEEITALGGSTIDAIEDGPALYARGVLNWLEEVRRDDKVQGGIALRSTGRQVYVHPYVHRLICKNGAIAPRVIGTELVELPDFSSVDEAAEAVRAAIRACGDREVFSRVVERMRTAQEMTAEILTSLLPMMEHLRGAEGKAVFQEIVRRFLRDEGPSRFGLLNAVTSVARDTQEPALRWDLEELGGSLVVNAPWAPRPGRTAAKALVPV